MFDEASGGVGQILSLLVVTADSFGAICSVISYVEGSDMFLMY